MCEGDLNAALLLGAGHVERPARAHDDAEFQTRWSLGNGKAARERKRK